MKIFRILFWSSFLCISFACTRNTFTTTILPPESDEELHIGHIRNLKPCSDGGYVLLGSGIYESVQKVFLMKFDKKGDLSWTKLFDGYFREISVSMRSLYYGVDHLWVDNENNILFTMSTNKYKNGKKIKHLMSLISIDLEGKVVWSKELGNESGYMINYDISPLKHGGYLLTGQVKYHSPRLFLSKISRKGDIMWSKMYSSGLHGINSVQTTNGEFIILAKKEETIGWSGVPIEGERMLFLRTDSLGIPLQLERFSLNHRGDNSPHTLIQINDNELLIVGENFFIKTDTHFSSQKIYHAPSVSSGPWFEIQSVQAMGKQGWLGSGAYHIDRKGNTVGFAIKFDTTNQIEWAIREDTVSARMDYVALNEGNQYIIGGIYVYHKEDFPYHHRLPTLFTVNDKQTGKKKCIAQMSKEKFNFKRLDSLEVHTTIPTDRIVVENIPLSFESVEIQSETINLKTTNK